MNVLTLEFRLFGTDLLTPVTEVSVTLEKYKTEGNQ